MIRVDDVINQVIGRGAGRERGAAAAVRIGCADRSTGGRWSGEGTAVVHIDGRGGERSGCGGGRASDRIMTQARVPPGKTQSKRPGYRIGEYGAVLNVKIAGATSAGSRRVVELCAGSANHILYAGEVAVDISSEATRESDGAVRVESSEDERIRSVHLNGGVRDLAGMGT